MTLPELTPMAESPISIRPEHVAAEATKLIVRQSAMSFSGGDITVRRKDADADADAEAEADADAVSPSGDKSPPLYTCEGKAVSWTQRRTVYDSAGLALFEIYRKASGVTWYVHVPGGGDDTEAAAEEDRPLVTLAMERSMFKDKYDVCVHGGGGDGGGDVQLKVLGQDIWKIRTNVYRGDEAVMTAKRQGKLDVYIPGKSLVWDVDVAPGFDTSLVRFTRLI